MFKMRSLSVMGALLLAGCAEQSVSPPTSETQTVSNWKEGLDTETVTAFSQLSDLDRTAALAQKVCPVTDKPLGSMGKPPKITVAGQDVFLCCSGCEEDLKKESAKYLAKLKSK